jgi:hypothetical protein
MEWMPSGDGGYYQEAPHPTELTHALEPEVVVDET